jgi:hypothetical protein
LSPYGDCEAESKIKADTTAVLIGFFIVMKLEELSKEDLILKLKVLYNRYRLTYIDLVVMEMECSDLDRQSLVSEYISEILSFGIDEVIIQNVGDDFD